MLPTAKYSGRPRVDGGLADLPIAAVTCDTFHVHGGVMSGYYGRDDVSGTWAQGKEVAALDGDAAASGDRLVTTLGATEVGTQFAGGLLATRLEEYQTDAAQASHEFANAVSQLGTSVITGAKEAADTNNDGTRIANTTLSRVVNQLPFTPRAE